MGVPVTTSWTRRDPSFFKLGSLLNFTDATLRAKYASFPAGFLDAVFAQGQPNTFPADGLLTGARLGFYFLEALQADDWTHFGDDAFRVGTAFTQLGFNTFIRLDDLAAGNPSGAAGVPPGYPAYPLTDVWTIGYDGPTEHFAGAGPTTSRIPLFDATAADLQAAIGGDTSRYVVMFAIGGIRFPNPFSSSPALLPASFFGSLAFAPGLVFGSLAPGAAVKAMTIVGLARVGTATVIPHS